MLGTLITNFPYTFIATAEVLMHLPAQSLSKAGEYNVVTTSNLF